MGRESTRNGAEKMNRKQQRKKAQQENRSREADGRRAGPIDKRERIAGYASRPFLGYAAKKPAGVSNAG